MNEPIISAEIRRKAFRETRCDHCKYRCSNEGIPWCELADKSVWDIGVCLEDAAMESAIVDTLWADIPPLEIKGGEAVWD